jgi:hypothetical protein
MVVKVMAAPNLQEDQELLVVTDLIYKAATRLITAVVEGEDIMAAKVLVL